MSVVETDEQTETRIAAEMTPEGEAPEEETGDVTEPDDDETQPDDDEPEAQRADRTGDVEKISRSLEKEAVRHAGRIEDLMQGDFAGLVPCELCWELAPGFRWDRAPADEQIAKVRVAIGMPDLSNYAPSATERQCDDCRGLGKVRTGSTVSGRESITCDACAGKGYVATRPRLNSEAAAPELEPVVNGGAPVVDDGVKRDMFGTPEGDPDYGLMPNMRARPTDYWQTHRA